MKSFLIIILMFTSMAAWAQKPDTTSGKPDTINEGNVILIVNPHIVSVADLEKPQFPGGDAALQKFIKDNTNYPAKAKAKNINGQVIVTFVVDTNGTITNLKVLKNLGGSCSDEAIRVVKLMPKWIPATKKGKAIKAEYKLPINFPVTQ